MIVVFCFHEDNEAKRVTGVQSVWDGGGRVLSRRYESGPSLQGLECCHVSVQWTNCVGDVLWALHPAVAQWTGLGCRTLSGGATLASVHLFQLGRGKQLWPAGGRRHCTRSVCSPPAAMRFWSMSGATFCGSSLVKRVVCVRMCGWKKVLCKRFSKDVKDGATMRCISKKCLTSCNVRFRGLPCDIIIQLNCIKS